MTRSEQFEREKEKLQQALDRMRPPAFMAPSPFNLRPHGRPNANVPPEDKKRSPDADAGKVKVYVEGVWCDGAGNYNCVDWDRNEETGDYEHATSDFCV